MAKTPQKRNTQGKGSANAMWGGHYAQGPAEVMERINASIDVDKRLYVHDIAASRAHARMLASQNILSPSDVDAILRGLDQVEREINDGEMQWSTALEDIHMHVEARLKDIIGPAAGRLHTARSRNDQVATDFRLWLRDAIDQMDKALADLQTALIDRAEEHVASICPGFTHLQVAQPVTFGHHLMAYAHMLRRDRARLQDCRTRLNECPLGSAALAGTSFPIDREATAHALGFAHPTYNSLDGVAARDFALEFLSVAAIGAQHLSRLAEELIIWSSTPFGFITLSEAFTSGSSIMPQKRNADGAELVRGKSGRIFGDLIALLTTCKGLPLAYNKDLQEDKEPVFDASDNWLICVQVTTGMIRDMQVNTDAMLTLAGSGYSTATDLADWLVRELGLPFRDAHHTTGAVVKLAETAGCSLHEVSLADMQAIHPDITSAVYDVLSVEQSVASRQSLGGTAPKQVKREIDRFRKEWL